MLNIHIDPNSFTFSEARSTTGQIWLSVEGKSFPSKNWSDFVVNLLIWWSRSYFEYCKSGGRNTLEFDFMEGPYSLHGATSNKAGFIDLKLFERKNIVYSHQCIVEDLGSQLVNNLKLSAERAKERQGSDTDYTNLISAIETLESLY